MITINDQYMIDQIDGILSSISRNDQMEIINMLNKEDMNEQD